METNVKIKCTNKSPKNWRLLADILKKFDTSTLDSKSKEKALGVS